MNKSILVIGAILVASLTQAATLSNFAFDNATIQGAGARTGVNGQNFMNMEGSVNGSFASYGVVDFNGTSTISTGTNAGTYGGVFNFGGPVNATSLSLRLTQSNAAFTLDGGLQFFLATANLANDIRNVSPAPVFADGAAEFGIVSLGTGVFTRGQTTPAGGTTVGNGTQDLYTFALSSTAQDAVNSALNGSTRIRLVIAPNDATVAATYAGFSFQASPTSTPPFDSGDSWRPQLSIDASPVPEPASIAVLSLGLGALIRRRRNR